MHHIIYRSELGPDASWNLCTLCVTCHDAVHSGNLNIWSDAEHIGADGFLEFFVTGGWKP